MRLISPRVVVMDMSMPGLDGVQATREILKKAPSIAILILSMYAESNYIRNAFDAVIADSHRMPGAAWSLGKTLVGHAMRARG